jgi:hypothetical protein
MSLCYFLLKTTDSSLRIFLLVQLYTAIYLEGDIFDTALGDPPCGITPLKLDRTLISQWFQRPHWVLNDRQTSVCYSSAIGLTLAAKSHGTHATISRGLLDSVICATSVNQKIAAECLEATGRITETGWLELHLDDRALVKWLIHTQQSIPLLPLIPASLSPIQQQDPRLWPALHTHVRINQILATVPSLDHTKSLFPLAPVDRPILVALLTLVDTLCDLPVVTADRYLDFTTQLVDRFTQMQQQYTTVQLVDSSTLRWRLIILIRDLLERLLYQGLGQKIPSNL